MAHKKERRKIIHQPTTQEIFMCLAGMPIYSKILLANNPDKHYSIFLNWLIEVNFYNISDKKITIKQVANDFKSDTTKVTKWINDIYNDIFELNFDNPELFQKEGIKVKFYMRSYDNYCSFFTSLAILPREFETLHFSFVQAKMGINFFWVKKIDHSIENDIMETTVWLEGGFVNKYREYALDKALFQGWIGFMDVYNKESFEIDKELKNLYRN